MKTRAAVLEQLGQPLVIAELDIPDLRPGQVLVEIACAGVSMSAVANEPREALFLLGIASPPQAVVQPSPDSIQS